MGRTGLAATLTGAFLLWALAVMRDVRASEIGGQTPGPQQDVQGLWRRQAWRIPLPGQRLLLHATLMRPPGNGPFPLAVINHGSSQSSARRATFNASGIERASLWFLERGYAVLLPVRPGHGETGGPYFEDQGRCEDPDYHKAGIAAAASIQAATEFLMAQPFIAKSGAIVVGQSAGGWGALALASRNPPAVRAVINFSGGRGGRSDNLAENNCVPDRLVATAGEFGRTARIPTLWLYAENDSFFDPGLSKRMVDAFRAAGGRADYHLLPPFMTEGHVFFERTDALPLWRPIVENFLAKN